ncbi:MAG TPA: WG repeat-containing protein, partial [Fibrobacteria bacterium]|nr:WG repeat-containing protein [Fibrobacteria bacterium]
MFLSLLLSALCQVHPDSLPWRSFTDPVTERIGFKDASGKIRIPARFSAPNTGAVFRDVIAVAEPDSSSDDMRMYYLRKDGRIFGRDSVPIVEEFELPCQVEGRILFSDQGIRRPPTSDPPIRMGYFDSTGKVAVPARFVYASSFHGGYAVAMEEGKRMCGDGKPWSKQAACEHWYWSGEHVLVDREGRVVAKPLELEDLRYPDWLRAKALDAKPDSNSIGIPLLDGRYLSIPDIKRDFRAWFSDALPGWKGSAISPDLFFPTVYAEHDGQWSLGRGPNLPETVWSGVESSRFLRANRAKFAGLLDTFRRHLSQLDFHAKEEPVFAEHAGLLGDCGRFDPVRFPAVRVCWDP